MSPRRRFTARSIPNWLSWSIASALLVLLLSSTFWLYQNLRKAEAENVQRYLDAIVTHVETDLIGSAGRHVSIQNRMALRLAFDGPVNRSMWAADARRLIDDHPYYYLQAVLDADYRVRWLQGRTDPRVREQFLFPLGPEARARLESVRPDQQSIALEPISVGRNQPGILFMTPITSDGRITHWLAAVMLVPDSVESMLTGFYLDDVVLTARFAGTDFIVPEDAAGVDVAQAGSRRLELPLADGQSEMVFDIALRAEAAEAMASALPNTVLVLGSGLAILLVAAAWLAMAAARQARVLAGANRTLTGEIRDREMAERELAFLLTHDSLSGLPNRQGMLRKLERAIEQRDPEDQLAVLFLDLDQFKDINETLGHHLGDELLSQIPGRLSRELTDEDLIGRLGGDEFLVIARRRSAERVRRLAAALLKCLEEPFHMGEHHLFVTASIGIAFFDSTSTSAGEMIQNADAALFRAKHLGRNQCAVFTPEMFAQVEYRLNLSRDIREALDREEFQVVYQPVVNLRTLKMVGVEALLRWPHRDGYNVPPRDFVRVAEETGMVHRLSQFAVRRALGDLAAWQEASEDAPWLAVNISGAQFREPEFVRDLSMMLHRHRLDPSRVHLEITEEVLIENLSRNRSVLEQLDQIGMPIVVDDFGVGYSSLAYIKNFPVSTIKIDQGFIRGLENDREDQAITRTICNLSADLGLQTVAEGIEQESQLLRLREYGCQCGQGFLFMHPSPARAISSILDGAVPWANLSRRITSGPRAVDSNDLF